jgi:hypothetical protein
MNHRRIICTAISLALSFGVLAAGSASAAPYGGHAMRKYGPTPTETAQATQQAQWAEAVRALDSGAVAPSPVSSAQGIQQAQWAEAVRALDSGAVVPPAIAPAQSALDKQSAQYAAQVQALNDGTVSLQPGDLRGPGPVAEPLPGPGSSPGTTLGFWLTIGLLSGLLALATSIVLRRRPRPQLSV